MMDNSIYIYSDKVDTRKHKVCFVSNCSQIKSLTSRRTLFGMHEKHYISFIELFVTKE